MGSRRFLGWFLTVLCLSSLGFAQVTAPDFTFILFPDTQNESQYFPNVLDSETAWVANNRSALNIQAVLGLGDIVNDGASTAQQQNADAAIKTLDNAGIPYFLAIGNHDYDGANTGAASRTATGFNQWFGPSRYAGKSYYKGNFPSGSNENFYGELTINGKQYLILLLEYIPRTAALNWAAGIVQANPDKEVIVVTHSFTFVDGTRVDQCDTNDLNRDNDGDESWNAFESQYPNIIMVVSGHLTATQAARRADLGVNGNLVNEMFSNYQTLANGGDGWLRIVTFHPGSNTITVKTYSPYLNAYKTDGANQFTVNYHNPGFNTGVGKITGKVKTPRTNTGGCTAISNATVSAGGASTVTDSSGHFSLSLAPGTYTASATASGFSPQSRTIKVDDNYSSDNDFYLTNSSTPPCTLNSTSPSVTICTPTANASVSSPVNIVAGSRDSKTVQFMQIYVDGAKKYQVNGNQLNTSLAMTAGTRRLTVQAYDGSTYFHQTIYINVTGAQPAVSVTPTSLTFSSQNVGSSSAAKTVSATNETSSAVSISSITSSGDYSETNNCGSSLAAGASCTVSVTFTPTAAGTRTGTLTLTDSASNSPQTVSLSGTGASSTPAFTVSPASLTFGSQNVGSSSAPQQVGVVNNTSGAVSVTSIAATGDYSQANNCGTSIAAGASCSVSVTFTPIATGTRTGTLTLTDSDPSSPQTVSLTGTGTSTSSCTLSTVSPSVTICSPAPNATVSSPVSVVGGATDTKTVQFMQIYVDGVKKYQVSGKQVNTSLAMTVGAHRITVQAYDGTYFHKTVNMTVAAAGVSVAISPTSASVAVNQTQQFTATVSGSSNTSATWSVDGIAGGNTTVGTVSTTGLYTAPGSAGSHTVTATSAADTTKSASAAVTVTSSAGVSVTISPTSASVQVNQTKQFTATVSGNSNTSATWSVDGVAGGNSTAGTVSTSGLYTAPGAAGSHTVTATSAADTTKSASAAVTVTASSSCTLSTVSPSVTICTPAANATVSSPVSIVAGSTDSKTVTLMQIYLDGVKKYEVAGNKLNTSLAMTVGTHRLTVQAYDGTYFKQTINITVQ